MVQQSSPRRDLLYFGVPAVLTLAAALAYHLRPWPIAVPAQAAVFAWPVVIAILAAGAIGVGLSSRVGCASAPPVGDGKSWAILLGISCALGFAWGVLGLCISEWPPFADHLKVLALQSGMPALATWINVALPWSIPHYFVGSVLLECLYRLAPIPILTWLVSNVALRGRGQRAVFWTAGILAALQDPLTWLLGMVHGPLPAPTMLFALFNAAQLLACNLLEVVGFRRYGWPSAIAFRVAAYAAQRVFLPYLLSPHSVSYPGPH